MKIANRFLLLLLLLPPAGLFADEIRVTPLDFWKQTSLWNDSLSVDQLIESSIHASGVENPAPYIKTFKEKTLLLGDYLNTLARDTPTEILGELLLHWMHEHILTGRYIHDQTRMDVLFDKGDYNCVSSAVLYLVLTRYAGLDTQGEETKDHSFCTLRSSGGTLIDVETTTVMGFNPGTKKEFGSDFEGRTGFAYVKPGDYSRRQAITDKKMVSLILQNRIAFYQHRGQYNLAVGLAVDRWFFYPIKPHEKDMNDSFRNWVASLNLRGEYLTALEFLLPLSQEMGLLDANRDLINTLIYNQGIYLSNKYSLSEARSFLDLYKSFLSDSHLAELNGMIDSRDIEQTVNGESYETALEKVRKFKAEERITLSKANEFLTLLHQNKAIILSSQKGIDQAQGAINAYMFLEQLPPLEADLPGVKNHRKLYLENWAVFIHNDFVLEANRKNYDEARKILLDAMKINDSSDLLKSDLTRIEQIMNRE